MFYVYRWFIEDSNITFYIGKGSGDRYKQTKKRNKKFKKVLENNKCSSEIMMNFENEIDAFAYEHKMICEYKQKGECFCNLDDGGVGGCSFIWTPEMKEYFSENNCMKLNHQRQRMSVKNPMKNKDVATKVGLKHRKPFYVGELVFTKLSEAAEYYNTSQQTVKNWLKVGHKGNIIVHYVNKPPVEYISKRCNVCKKVLYKGIIYESAVEVAKHLNITKAIVYNAIKRGFFMDGTSIKYVNDKSCHVFKPRNYATRNIPIVVNNVQYKSIKEAAISLNTSANTISSVLHGQTKKSKYECNFVNQ